MEFSFQFIHLSEEEGRREGEQSEFFQTPEGGKNYQRDESEGNAIAAFHGGWYKKQTFFSVCMHASSEGGGEGNGAKLFI